MYDNDAFSCSFADGVATLTMNMAGGVNKIGAVFLPAFADAVRWAAEQPGLAGVILASAHRDFCVGADLELVYGVREPAVILDVVRQLDGALRRLETLGVPVVAVITGAALGGGYELCLGCHHRIALDGPAVQVGLPEVQLGVIPGGGGTQRLPRLLGFQASLELLLQGTTLRAPAAKAKGLVDALAPTPEAAHAAARAWIAANPKAKQPWDRSGWSFPAPGPGTPDARNLLLAAQAMLYKRTAGAFPAAEALLAVVQEGAGLTFDRAVDVEARAFARLVVSDQAKDMIRTLFFFKNAADKAPLAPAPRFTKIAVLGAGMMGAGIAFVAAKAGYSVILKDVRPEGLAVGVAHLDAELGKLKHLDAAAKAELRGRITATLELSDLAGCDLVIEAVFEDLALKHRVTREIAPLLAPDAVWASNTSAIPIAELATAFPAPERFIGLHFFSPVEQMPLLEVITPPGTADATRDRCLRFGRDLKKTVIVVNDGYGFYTTRLFSAYILEGAELVAEGYDPAVIEWAARTAGMVVPPLQVFDEVTLTLGAHALTQAVAYREAKGLPVPPALPAFALLRELVAGGRAGRASGAGFYDYANGKRGTLWPGLRAGTPLASDVPTLARRMMLAQVAEVARCLDERIVRSAQDAEIGAIFGVGFAPNTGGPAAFMDRYGLPRLVADLDALAATHGERYAPAPLLRQMAASGERFFPN